MYLKFYGLREPPFNVTPDPHFLYFTRHHREAYDLMLYGILHRKGFIELTGEVGSGKTTLLRAILSALGDQVHTALIVNPALTGSQLMRAMLRDFGLQVRSRDRLACIEALNEFLLEQSAMGRNVALFIDEAQNLSPDLMEQVRLLSNLETDQHKLLQIVLCGQPELKERLARPELRQLRQRVTVRYHLPPLTYHDALRYICHRLDVAGAEEGSIEFDAKAIKAIFRYTGGSPRLTNAVCDGALLAGYAAGMRTIDVRCVERSIQHLRGQS
jgi:general secretion pathway protein A